MLNRLWESLRLLMAEPDDLRTLPTCDLSVTDAARIELLMDELQVSAFALAVQAEERQRLGGAVLVARDAQSLTLRFADADVASSRLNHRVNLVGASSHGLLVFPWTWCAWPGRACGAATGRRSCCASSRAGIEGSGLRASSGAVPP
jgi:hypothetical protein